MQSSVNIKKMCNTLRHSIDIEAKDFSNSEYCLSLDIINFLQEHLSGATHKTLLDMGMPETLKQRIDQSQQ